MTSALPLRRDPAQPLRLAEFDSRPSTLERALRFIPILGWIAAQHLEGLRFHPFVKRIDGILCDRRIPRFEWPSSRHVHIAAIVGGIIQEQFRWSSVAFHPDDGLAVLFYDDDGSSIEVMLAVEERLGVSLEDVTERYCEDCESMTFGELVERVTQRVRVLP